MPPARPDPRACTCARAQLLWASSAGSSAGTSLGATLQLRGPEDSAWAPVSTTAAAAALHRVELALGGGGPREPQRERDFAGVSLLSAAGTAIALAVAGAAGVFLVRRRSAEAALLNARGEHPVLVRLGGRA